LAAITAILIPIAIVGRRRFGVYGEEEHILGERLITELTQSLAAIKAIQLAEVRQRRMVVTLAIRLAVETSFICAMLLAVAVMTLSGRSAPEVVSLLGLYAYSGF